MVTVRRRFGDLEPVTITQAQLSRDWTRLAQTRRKCLLVVLRHMQDPADGHLLLAMLGLVPERSEAPSSSSTPP